MALNFPSSPSVNSTYTFNGKTWTYTGNAWALSYGTLNTGTVPEGSNLYFTNARATAAVTNASLSNITVSGNATVSGNFGIGTTSIINGEKLKVAGPVYINAAESDTVFTPGASLIFPGTYNNIRQSTNHDLQFDTYNAGTIITPLTIKQNGNIGIGTASPSYPLHVNSPSSLASIGLTGNATGFTDYKLMQGVAGVTNSGFSIYDLTSSAIRFVIDNSGNVGIGTGSPGSYGKFAVVGSGSTSSVLDSGSSRITNTVVSGGGSWTQYYKDLTPTYVAGIGTYNPTTSAAVSALVFADYQGGWTERARIDSSGNLGIGTSSPASKLDVASSNSGITLTNTAVSNKQWRLGGSSAGSFVITETGIADRLTINTSGNVGIGTTSPATTLHVAGGTIRNSGTNGVLQLLDGNTSGGVKIAAYNTAVNANGYLAFEGYSIEYGRFDASGNLGIGTSTLYPSAAHPSASQIRVGLTGNFFAQNSAGLGIAGTSLLDNAYIRNSTGDFAYITSAKASRVILLNGNVYFQRSTGNDTADGVVGFNTSVFIGETGNLGIGTTNPSSKFEVKFTANDYGYFSNSGDNNTGIRIQNTGRAYGIFVDGGAGASNSLRFYDFTAGAERARIDSSGNLGIGTASPAAKLDITQPNNTEGDTALRVYAENRSQYTGISFNSLSSTYYLRLQAGTSHHLTLETNGAERARISSAGGFSVGTTADPGAGAIYATGDITTSYSDARLKDVSGKIENALDKVSKLSGVYYKNNDLAKSFGYASNEPQVGVLAGEVEAVLPEVVKAAPFDIDQDGNSKSRENYKTVQYERLVPLLIEAIKEQQAVVAQLQARIDAAGL